MDYDAIYITAGSLLVVGMLGARVVQYISSKRAKKKIQEATELTSKFMGQTRDRLKLRMLEQSLINQSLKGVAQ
jgi:hypothetical protein